MKTLYLLRHAKSSWKDTSLDDYDRPLNKRGITNTPMMAERFKQKQCKWDVIISSGALRAKATAEVFAKALDKTLKFDDAIYDAVYETLLELIEGYFKRYDHLMVVGHNFELTELSNYLSNSYIENIVTCGVVILNSKNDKIKKGSMNLVDYDYPKK